MVGFFVLGQVAKFAAPVKNSLVLIHNRVLKSFDALLEFCHVDDIMRRFNLFETYFD